MSWLRFDDLSADQAIAALEHLANHVENIAKLRRPESREFLVVDGSLVGSRIIITPKDREFVAKLTGENIRSKTDLKDWKSTPTPFHMNNE